MEPKLSLSFLGKMSVVLNGQNIMEQFSVKHQALLAYLAMTGRTHSRAALATLLWGDDIGEGDEQARNSLRVALSSLRKWLADYLVVTRTDISFDRQAGCTVDIDEFERLTRMDSAETADLRQAAALLRGPFLDGLMIEDVAALDEWIVVQREFWRQRAMAVLAALAGKLLAEGELREAAQVLTQALAIEPWAEELHRMLMVVYGRMGNFNAALMQYDRLSQLLLEDLGVEPDEATTALYHRIQTARQTSPRTLPLPGTAFVGREKELAEIARKLADPSTQILTITGLGGAGKTRLALVAANQANQEGQLQFLDGVAFVSLAGEHRLHLDGLAYPREPETVLTAGEALDYEAVRLFVHNAQQVRPTYELATADIRPVVHLCRLVSGLPLALQLAAAWLRVMGLREITAEVERNLDLLATRLRDTPPRQRSIRAVFEQTWSLLSPGEQGVFQSLAVFRGGFSPEAAGLRVRRRWLSINRWRIKRPMSWFGSVWKF